jgi:hypothetical protein
MQTHKRPDLREPIRALLDTLIPAVRDGGAVPLTDLVVAVAGAKLTGGVRVQLDARGAATFARNGSTSHFFNEGPETRIKLKSFDIKIPAKLAGAATIDEAGGAKLVFEPKRSLHATKLLVSVRLDAVVLSAHQVLVKMETAVFDQCFDLA